VSRGFDAATGAQSGIERCVEPDDGRRCGRRPPAASACSVPPAAMSREMRRGHRAKATPRATRHLFRAVVGQMRPARSSRPPPAPPRLMPAAARPRCGCVSSVTYAWPVAACRMPPAGARRWRGRFCSCRRGQFIFAKCRPMRFQRVAFLRCHQLAFFMLEPCACAVAILRYARAPCLPRAARLSFAPRAHVARRAAPRMIAP